MTLKAVGGWLVALMAWLVAASRDTISQAVIIYVLAFLIPAGGLVHCIAGSSEVLISVFAGEVSFLEYLGGFLLPTTLGSTIGGVILVTLLNYGQVAASKSGPRPPSPGTLRRAVSGRISKATWCRFADCRSANLGLEYCGLSRSNT